MKCSPETRALLKRIKGNWWQDEINRREDPNYIRARLESLVSRFGTLKGARVLDVGSGSGSSALVMLDCGAAHVTGVEPDARFVDLAARRARDEGVTDRVTFLRHEETARLPFRDGEFGIVTFNAVIEHLPPTLRRPILREAYRCLAPGGLLVVDETPNRLIPYDGHTTGLPLIPWLPLPLAASIAKRFSRIERRGLTRKEYVSAGIIGGTYWRIARAIPDAACLNANGGDAKWKCSRRTCPTAVSFFLSGLERLLNVFGIPFNAVTPSLDLVFRKPSP